MTLELKLKIRKTDLRYQEDTLAELTLVNRGTAPLTLVDLRRGTAGLQWRVIDVKTGVETVHARPRPANCFSPERESPMNAGETRSAITPLPRPLKLVPGDYEISVIQPYDQDRWTAESAPVRVKVRPTTPRALFCHEGGGVWVNTLAEPPEVVLMDFIPSVGGGPEDLRVVGPAGLRAAPVLSGNLYQDPIRHCWVAWIDEGGLKSVHMHAVDGPSPVRAAPLAGPGDFIVPPLHSEPTPDNDARSAGALLLYRASGELETIALGLDKMSSVARAPLPGPRPLWIRGFEREGNTRSLLVAQAYGDQVRLSEAFWPGSGKPLRTLGEWPGTFMGAGAVAADANTLIGSLLIRRLAGSRLAWDRIDFTLDAKGTLTPLPAAGPVSDPADPFEAAPSVIVSPQTVAALLKTSKGFWWVYDGSKTAPVPYDLRQTPFPLELELMNDMTPLLIAGFKEAGFHMRMADGRPMPAGG